MKEQHETRTMHLFAGVGGGLLADLILGHTPIVAVEWDAYACQVLRERAAEGWFPELRVWEGDVRLFDPSEYAGRVDCIHAGFPCTDVSTAGTKLGVVDGTRSGLYREVLRVAGIVRPRQIFLENVPAIVSNGLPTVLRDLAALGYDSRWCCLSASHVGANHRRDRWWLLANANDKSGLQTDSKVYAVREKWNSREDVGGGYWSQEPELSWAIPKSGNGRMGDGIPNRVDRFRALGNAQVPLQAAVAYKLLGG